MNDIEIESLLFKQVEKPKHFLMTRVINVYENRYRINVYIQIEEDMLIKKRISSSYFCHYFPGKLEIIPDREIRKMKAKEKPVKGTRGFIMYSPFRKVPFFRVYNEDKTFIDYDINCEELGVELISDWNSFYAFSDGSNTLDFSSKALGRTNET